MYIDKFFYLTNNKCYYSDTDIFFQKLLESKYIGEELGQFKFKVLIKRAYFITPKLYCLILEDDKIIIKSKCIPTKTLNESDFEGLLYSISKKNYK